MAKEKKSKLSRRITWSVIGIMVFFNGLIIFAIHMFVYDVSVLLGNSRGQYVIDGIGGKMETMLNVVERMVVNGRAEVEENLDSPEWVFDALAREIRINNKSAGYFAAFEPDYFKEQGRWFEAYVYHADSIRYDRRQIGSASHDYFQIDWYQKGMSLSRHEGGYLTDPYLGDSVVSGRFCSFVAPIFDYQNHKVGVFGIDLGDSWIDIVIQNAIENVRKEFLENKESTDPYEEILFSIQVLDSKGNRIAGSDSLDLAILQNDQKQVHADFEYKNIIEVNKLSNYQ